MTEEIGTTRNAWVGTTALLQLGCRLVHRSYRFSTLHKSCLGKKYTGQNLVLKIHKFFSGYDHCACTSPRRFATLK